MANENKRKIVLTGVFFFYLLCKVHCFILHVWSEVVGVLLLLFFISFFFLNLLPSQPCVGERWSLRSEMLQKGLLCKKINRKTRPTTRRGRTDEHQCITTSEGRILMIVWFNSKRLSPPPRHVDAHIPMCFAFVLFFS